MTEDEIRRDFPDLAREDIKACLAFAADRERRPLSGNMDETVTPRKFRVEGERLRSLKPIAIDEAEPRALN